MRFHLRHTSIFISAAFLFLPLLTSASPKDLFRDYRYNDERGNWFFAIHAVFGYVSYQPQPGPFSVKFPYTLTDRHTGTQTTKNFTMQTTDMAGKGKWMQPGVGLEIGKGHVSAEGYMGIYIHQWSDYLLFGLNYRFTLNKHAYSLNKHALGATAFPTKKQLYYLGDFPVKLSLGIFYWQPLWNLGNIDIADNQFYALGHVMQNIDSTVVGNAGRVTVFYQQNILAFTPNFTIGYHPQDGFFDISFRIAPVILIAQRGGLRFYMKNSPSVEWAPTNGISLDSVIPFDASGMDATFNGEKIETAPFHFQGIMYTLKIGLRFD